MRFILSLIIFQKLPVEPCPGRPPKDGPVGPLLLKIRY